MPNTLTLRTFLLFAGAIFAPLGFAADPLVPAPPSVQLRDLLQSVQHHYPLIRQNQQDALKAQAELRSAQGGFDPVLKARSQNVPLGYYQHGYQDISLEQPTPLWGTRLSGGWRLGNGDFPYYDGKQATFTKGELRAGIEVPVLRGGEIDERRNKILSAENGVETTNATIALAQLEINRLATHRFWEWLAAGKKLQIAENLLDIVTTRDQGLLHRFQKGDAPQYEHRENQRVLLQRQSLLLAAQRAFQKATLDLSLYYRNEEGNPILLVREQLPANFPPLEASKNPSIYLKGDKKELSEWVERHPEIKRLSTQLNQIQLDLDLSKNLLLPRLDLQVGYSLDLGIAPIPSKASSYSLQPLVNTPGELKLGLVFEFPLFQRAARGKNESAQASYNRLQEQAFLTKNKIETALVDSIQAMETAKQRALLAHEELTLAHGLEEGERIRFKHGDSQLFLVSLREQSSGEAAIKEVESTLEYQKAQADWIAISGGQGLLE